MQASDSILGQITDVKGPDGLSVLHHSTAVKQDLNELKRRFANEAKKSYREFTRVQKRSKMMITK